MAKPQRNTFGGLTTTLKGLGFEMVKTSGHVMFKHHSGRPMFLLPAYKPGESLQPIHQMMVWKQLKDAGLIEDKASASKFSVKPKKKPSKPTLKAKS
jgi:predicted RNA binding protein YcfA (HicA-like mRNA interferase family)